jgi:hypothetical protein
LRGKLKIKIALKFCGSCNPEIDLSGLAGQVKRHISSRSDIEFVAADTPGTDLLIVLCGCLRACVDKQDIWGSARQHIVIAGESLSGASMNEDRLAELLAAEIDRFFVPPGD